MSDILEEHIKRAITASMFIGFLLGLIAGAYGFWLYHTRHECITDTQCTEMHNGQPGYGG